MWLPYNSHLATTQLLYDYHTALMWYTVIPIQLPYTTALTCRVVRAFPHGYHTTLVWLPYNSFVVHDNSHMATIHSTRMQGAEGIFMFLSHVDTIWDL